MAEALGVAGSLIGIVAFGLSVSKELYEVAQSVAKASSRVQQLGEAVQLTSDALGQLNTLLSTSGAAISPSGVATIQKASEHCKSLFTDVRAILDKVKRPSPVTTTSASASGGTRIQNWSKRITANSRWALLEPQVEKLQVSLTAAKIDLLILLNIHMGGMARREEERQGLVETIKSLLHDHLKEVRNSSIPDVAQLAILCDQNRVQESSNWKGKGPELPKGIKITRNIENAKDHDISTNPETSNHVKIPEIAKDVKIPEISKDVKIPEISKDVKISGNPEPLGGSEKRETPYITTDSSQTSPWLTSQNLTEHDSTLHASTQSSSVSQPRTESVTLGMYRAQNLTERPRRIQSPANQDNTSEPTFWWLEPIAYRSFYDSHRTVAKYQIEKLRLRKNQTLALFPDLYRLVHETSRREAMDDLASALNLLDALVQDSILDFVEDLDDRSLQRELLALKARVPSRGYIEYIVFVTQFKRFPVNLGSTESVGRPATSHPTESKPPLWEWATPFAGHEGQNHTYVPSLSPDIPMEELSEFASSAPPRRSKSGVPHQNPSRMTSGVVELHRPMPPALPPMPPALPPMPPALPPIKDMPWPSAPPRSRAGPPPGTRVKARFDHSNDDTSSGSSYDYGGRLLGCRSNDLEHTSDDLLGDRIISLMRDWTVKKDQA